MSLRDLTSLVMLNSVARWLDPKKERPLLEKAPHLKPLLPDLEHVHASLKATQRKGTEAASKIAALTERTVELDAHHDRLARGLFDLLGGLSSLAETDEASEAFLLARTELLPQGMSTIGLSYQDEAGNAATTHDRLSPASRDLLKSTKVAGKSLAALVDHWRTISRKLGEADDERTALKQKGADGPTAADALAARNAFMRAVTALRAMVALETTLDDGEKLRILGYLDDAEAKASKRAARTKNDGEVTKAGDGTKDGEAAAAKATDAKAAEATATAEPGKGG